MKTIKLSSNDIDDIVKAFINNECHLKIWSCEEHGYRNRFSIIEESLKLTIAEVNYTRGKK